MASPAKQVLTDRAADGTSDSRLAKLQPAALLLSGWTHRELILRLSARRVESLYRGTLLGGLWAVLQPLILLAVYTFVFSVVFRTRWGGEGGSELEFAFFLFAGLSLYNFFAKCANDAPNLMLAYSNYIKSVAFPVECLAWVVVSAAAVDLLIGYGILLLAIVVAGTSPTLAWFYLPLIALPMVLLSLGTVWGLSALGVYLRDLGQVVGLATAALLFLSPVFYSLSRVPEEFQGYYRLNPIAPLIEASRACLFEAETPDLAELSLILASCFVFAWLAYLGFMRARRGFADVL